MRIARCVCRAAAARRPRPDGYVATAEVFFALWEQARERATAAAERAELARLARRMHWMLRKFSFVYPLARPQASRFRGLLEALSGNPVRARRAFAESVAEAERLSMPFEQGLAHYELGRRLPEGDPARRAHLGDARAIFERLGHLRWLARVNQLA